MESARDLGFIAEAHARIVKAKAAERSTCVSISASPSKTPLRLADLRRVLSPHLGRAVELAPQLRTEPLDRWLSERGWSYDPADVIAKPIGDAIAFAFPEREARQPVVVVILGDVVEQIEDPEVTATLFAVDE